MQIDKSKLKFYLKYLIPYGQLDKFKQRLDNMMLAVTINPDIAQEALQDFIKEYPFTKEFVEHLL